MSERIVTLLHKSVSDAKLNAAEKAELDEWIAMSPHNRSVFEETQDEKKLSKDIKELLFDDFGLSHRIIMHFLNREVKID